MAGISNETLLLLMLAEREALAFGANYSGDDERGVIKGLNLYKDLLKLKAKELDDFREAIKKIEE